MHSRALLSVAQCVLLVVLAASCVVVAATVPGAPAAGAARAQSHGAEASREDTAPRASATTSIGAPTRSEPLEKRTVPLKTFDPVSLFIPDLPGDVHPKVAQTDIYYYGTGHYPESTVYALVTGSKGVSDGPKTSYLYADGTVVYVPNQLRTANIGHGTTTAIFNLKCKHGKGMAQKGSCSYEYFNEELTTAYTKFRSKLPYDTTITPVQGQLQRMRQSDATGPTDVKIPAQTNSARAASWSRPAAVLLLSVVLAVLVGAAAL
ncbi:hypothetical protein MSPP1_001875 [Malassezia sp. CBS 17886]|nr:hypothetical protein MSPP1_001875 [Malassezia sp. CBS 17886]